MRTKANSFALVFVLIFTLMSPVFAAPIQEVQEGILKDGVTYIAADELVKSTFATRFGTKISANNSYNEIVLDGEVVGYFMFDKHASPLPIAITKDVTVIVEWKCAKYYMTCQLKGAGVYDLPQILQDNGKLKNFDQIWISFGAMLAPGTIINGAVPKTTGLSPVASADELAGVAGIGLNISDTTGLLTEYAARDEEHGATSKIMKYTAGETEFADTEEWNNTIPVETGDIFIIKVTAANGVATNYYKINAATYDATSYYTAQGFNIPGLTFQPTMPDTNGVRFQPSEVFQNVYFIGDSWVCAMLYDTGDGIVMWDSLEGTDDMINILEPDMKKLGLDPADIKIVFLSHGHGDHFGGAKYLQDTYGATVYLHEDDLSTMANGRPGGPTPPVIDAYYNTHVQEDGSVMLDHVTRGDVTFTFMHTPGHTPGSVSFFVTVTAFDGTQHMLTGWGGTSAPRDNLTGMIDAYMNSVRNYRAYINENAVDSFLSMHPFVDYSTDNVAAVYKTGSSDALIQTPEEMDLFCWSLLVYTQQKKDTLVFENNSAGYDPDVLNWPFVAYIPEEAAGNGALDLSIYSDRAIKTKIFDDVYLVGTGKDTCLIFDTADGIVIIDAMTTLDDFTQLVEPAMMELSLDPSRITAVMLTHGHADKTGFAAYLQQTYGATIYMNALDAGLAPALNVDLDLVENAYTFGAFTFDWYHTPGHTPGTMSFLVNVAFDGEAHTAACWGGTTFVYEKDALTDYAASIDRFLGICMDKGADAVVSTHPYFDFSVNKVLDIEDGNKNAFILDGDITLEFMLTSINVTAQYKLKSLID